MTTLAHTKPFTPPSTMYFRYTNSACVLFASLFIVIGCSHSGDVEKRYEQLLRKYQQEEGKIFEAMNLYLTTSEEIDRVQTQFLNLLGNNPQSSTIDLFMNRSGEIPSNLRAAQSSWRVLLMHRTNLLDIARWLDRQQSAGRLDELYSAIIMLEHHRRMARFLDENELVELERLLAQESVSWEPADHFSRGLLEAEAAEILRNELQAR